MQSRHVPWAPHTNFAWDGKLLSVFAFTQYLNSSAQLLMVKGGFSLPIYYVYNIPLFAPPVQPLALQARDLSVANFSSSATLCSSQCFTWYSEGECIGLYYKCVVAKMRLLYLLVRWLLQWYSYCRNITLQLPVFNSELLMGEIYPLKFSDFPLKCLDI